MGIRQQIQNYLADGGVTPFWVESALSWISRGLADNASFVLSISNPKLTVKAGHVSRFQCATVRSDGRIGTLSYSFHPTGHRLELA